MGSSLGVHLVAIYAGPSLLGHSWDPPLRPLGRSWDFLLEHILSLFTQVRLSWDTLGVLPCVSWDTLGIFSWSTSCRYLRRSVSLGILLGSSAASLGALLGSSPGAHLVAIYAGPSLLGHSWDPLLEHILSLFTQVRLS